MATFIQLSSVLSSGKNKTKQPNSPTRKSNYHVKFEFYKRLTLLEKITKEIFVKMTFEKVIEDLFSGKLSQDQFIKWIEVTIFY